VNSDQGDGTIYSVTSFDPWDRWALTWWLFRRWRALRWGKSCQYLLAGRWPCGVPSWVNPPADHQNWVGHPWKR
jgi:hypothetical protein